MSIKIFIIGIKKRINKFFAEFYVIISKKEASQP